MTKTETGPRAKTKSKLELPPPPLDNAPLIDWALWGAKIGKLTGPWKVFPCVPGEKHPLHKGWQAEATWDCKKIKAMWEADPKANIGLAIEPGYIVLDTDLYKPGAEAALAAFEAEHGELPRTLENATARGGYHLIYSTTKTFGNGQGTLPDFGDVRGYGGLIVGPGSVFEGNPYTVEHLMPPIALPPKIESMLRPAKGRDPSKPDVPNPLIVVDDPPNVQAFTNWCAGKPAQNRATPDGAVAKPCIESQGGNNMLAATGAMAHDYGLSRDVAFGIALEHHNIRCEPVWDDDVYEKHFCSGYDSATGQLGSRAPAQDYRSLFKARAKPDVTEKGNPANDDLEPLIEENFAQLAAKTSQPVAEIIRDRIEKGVVNFLSGPGGSHKSRLALQYCVCIGAQKPIFGKMPAKVTSVYVCAEDDEDEVIRRIQKLTKRLDINPDDLKDNTIYFDRTNLDSALVHMSERGNYKLTAFYHQLSNHIAELPGHKFVVLDSCYNFVRFEGNAKINEDAVNIFVKVVLGGFCRDTNSTLLIPWHPSYSGQARGDGSGWSVAWHNAPRVIDHISKTDKNSDTFNLEGTKRNHGALPQPLTLHYSDGALLPRSDMEQSEQKAQLADACIKVAILCAENGIPITQQRKLGKTERDLLREIIEIEPTNTEIKDVLNRAVIDGLLKYIRGTNKTAAGYYPRENASDLARKARVKSRVKSRVKTGVKSGVKRGVKTG